MSRPAATIHSRTEPAEIGLATVAPKPARVVLAALRVVLGFYFLWAFVDKLFGFGFHTAPAKAWINGGSPTTGFLSGVEGPFAGPFHAIAGAAWADWLFMAGLLGIGVALIAGAGLKIAAWTGALLLALMYLAEFPLGAEGMTNPLIDSHWIEALAIGVLAATLAGDTWGLGKWWGRHVGNGFLR